MKEAVLTIDFQSKFKAKSKSNCKSKFKFNCKSDPKRKMQTQVLSGPLHTKEVVLKTNLQIQT